MDLRHMKDSTLRWHKLRLQQLERRLEYAPEIVMAVIVVLLIIATFADR